MKKNFMSFALIFCAFANQAFCDCFPFYQPLDYCEPFVEAKIGYFFFADTKMSKIYNNGGADAQLSASYPIFDFFQIYASVEYVEKDGDKEHIRLVPISLGLKQVFNIGNCAQFYLTIGPRYTCVHVHNKLKSRHGGFFNFGDDRFVHRKHHETFSKNEYGGFVNTGFTFPYNEHLTFDIFAEYSYTQLHVDSQVFGDSAQIGGLTFGGGLSYNY